jgi:hypothetical protein
MSKISKRNKQFNRTPNQSIEPKKGLSRRSIFMGVAGATLAVGTGGVTVWNRMVDAGQFFKQYPFSFPLDVEHDKQILKVSIHSLNTSPYGRGLWKSLQSSGTTLRLAGSEDKMSPEFGGIFIPENNAILIQSPSFKFASNQLLCRAFFCAKSDRDLVTDIIISTIFTLANETLHARQQAKNLHVYMQTVNARETGINPFIYNIIVEICSDIASLRVLFDLQKIGLFKSNVIKSGIEGSVKKSEFDLFSERFSKAVSDEDIAKATAETILSLIKSKRYSGTYEDLVINNMAITKVKYEQGDLTVDMSTPLSDIYAKIETSLVESLDCGDFFKHLKISDIDLQMAINSGLKSPPPQP